MVRRLPSPLPQDAALIVIDLQKAIDHPSWGQRNNPDAERNVAALLGAWRDSQRPVYHIRHDSTEPASRYRPGQPGNEFKPEAQPLPGETVIANRKLVSSADPGPSVRRACRGPRPVSVFCDALLGAVGGDVNAGRGPVDG